MVNCASVVLEHVLVSNGVVSMACFMYVSGRSAKSMYSSAQVLCSSLVGRAGSAELMEVMYLPMLG